MSLMARDDVEAPRRPPTADSTEAKNEYDAAEASDDEEISYPEGGLQAWLVVLGSFCGM
jgi:hypothetical protein